MRDSVRNTLNTVMSVLGNKRRHPVEAITIKNQILSATDEAPINFDNLLPPQLAFL